MHESQAHGAQLPRRKEPRHKSMSTLEKVIKIIGEELGRENVSEADTLEGLGLDSLEFSSIMLAVSKQVAEIPESEWEHLNTVGDIAQAVTKYAEVSG